MKEIIEDVTKQYIPVFTTNNKKYSFDITPNVTYKGDMKLIKEMMELLLDNAVKYSDDSGNINVKLYTNGKNKKIIILNTTKEKLTGNLNNFNLKSCIAQIIQETAQQEDMILDFPLLKP